jgi:hypothetical protein
MAGTVNIRLDIVEPRTRYDRQAVTVDGSQWDLYASSGVGVDSVTNTAFLLPLPYTSEWQTTTSGNYARLQKAQYSLTTGTAWAAFDRNALAGNTYLQSLNINEKVYTPAVGVNAPIYLSWFAYNAGNSRFAQMKCGWGEQSSHPVELWFNTDNSVEVYRGGTLVSVGNLTDNNSYPDDYGDRLGSEAGKSTQNAGKVVDVILIPTRGRELLILSPTEGGGFNAVFDDIPDDYSDPITESGPFWWYVPNGQATVQCQAPMRFKTAGTVFSLPTTLRYPPLTGETPDITVYFNAPGYGVSSYTESVTDASGAAFTANGVADTVRLKYVLSGDGTATHYMYAGVIAFGGSAEQTAGGTIDVTPYQNGGSRLDVGESPSDVTFSFTLKSPADVVTAGAAGITTMGNRAFDARVGTVAFITGRTLDPQYQYGISEEVSKTVFECRDRWEAFDHCLIADPEPLDGVNLGTAFAYFAKLPGYSDSDLDIEYIDFTLPVVAAASQGEWGVIPEVGDTAGEWLNRLYEDFARTYYVGWRPLASGPKFCVYSSITLGTVPSGTVFGTMGSAGFDQSKVYRTFRQTTLRPEANDIYAVGQDRRTRLPIVAHYTDTASANPTTAVNARPANWLGEKWKYSLIAPEIVTQETANWAVGVLSARLSVARKMAEWRSDFLLKADGAPIWRGDVVKIDGYGSYRVNTISATFDHEGMTTPYRDCIYTAEYIGT